MARLHSETRATLRGLAFLSPWLIGFLAFTLVPIILSFYYSFCDYSLLQAPLYKGTANYNQLFHDPVFWKVLSNTLFYVVLALPLGTVVALGAAMLLNVRISGLAIYRTLIFLPSLVPTVASAMLWLWLFNANMGLINIALRAIGIDNPPGWLTDPRFAMNSLVLMSFWGIGNTVVIYLAGLQDVPRELYEAASIDGASTARQIWHVTIPAISPVIFFNLIMGIIGSLQIFATPLILTQGGPAQSTYFYTMYLYDNAFKYVHMGYASAMAWIQLLIVFALTGLAFWTSKHWVHYSGN
jgi:multiple sugar transport system permease protein